MWFSASIFFRSVGSSAPDSEELWEESIVVFLSNSAEEAVNRAKSIGKAREHSYMAIAGNSVSWKFMGVGKVFEIVDDEIKDGTEVYSEYTDARLTRQVFPDPA